MKSFIKVVASANSLSQRAKTHGIGVNDAWYSVFKRSKGVVVKCPIYVKWFSMLTRCYCSKYQERQPTYKGCTVCDEWLTFSNFSAWCELNEIEGYELDKDIKVKGNKVYSAENCIFVPRSINLLLNHHKRSRGDLPQGVSLNKSTGHYRVLMSIDGKRKSIGTFKTVEEARLAYVDAKNGEIKRKCREYPEFKCYLMNHLLKR